MTASLISRAAVLTIQETLNGLNVTSLLESRKLTS